MDTELVLNLQFIKTDVQVIQNIKKIILEDQSILRRQNLKHETPVVRSSFVQHSELLDSICLRLHIDHVSS